MSKGARNRSAGRKMRRAFRRTPDRYFDLVQYLTDRRYAGTKKQARDIILAKKVRADSHVLGVGKVVMLVDERPQEVEVVMQHVPIALKDRVIVSGEPTPPGRSIGPAPVTPTRSAPRGVKAEEA